MSKHSLIYITVLMLLLINAHAQTPVFQWANTINAPIGSVGFSKVAVHSDGSIYSAGTLDTLTDYDPESETFSLEGKHQIYFTKTNAAGTAVWSKVIGSDAVLSSIYQFGLSYGTGYSGYNQKKNYVSSVAVDASGNLYAFGYFSSDSIDFDPGPGTYYLNQQGGPLGYFTSFNGGMFLLKLDAAGNFAWVKGWAGNVMMLQSFIPSKMVLDQQGNIYTTGAFITLPLISSDLVDIGGPIDFDPGSGVVNLESTIGSNPQSPGSDIFVCKLNSSGDLIWAKAIGGEDNDQGTAIGVDASGNVYVNGEFNGTVDFDNGQGTSAITSNGENDIFMLKLNSSGNFIWVKRTGGLDVDVPSDLVLDAGGNMLSFGLITGSVDIDPGPGLMVYFVPDPANPYRTFIQKLDPDGNFMWGLAGVFAYQTTNAAIDGSGNIHVISNHYDPNGTVDIDPGGTERYLQTGATGSILISKFNATGTMLWAGQVECPEGVNQKWGIATGPNGAVVAGGSFYGTGAADLDPTTGISTGTGSGTETAFVLKLSNPCATAGTDVVTTNCPTYTWIDGITYTSSNNTATYTLTGSNNCDSIITLNLTLLSPPVGTDAVLSCGPYTWMDGNTYTASNNTATFTIPNGSFSGCDSIVQLNLTINANTDLYVDSSRVASGNGSSWATAFKTVSEALAVATSCTDIHVAKGTYYPSGIQNSSDRDSALAILSGGIKLLGGYPSGGGVRNPQINKVYLDGDIGTAGNNTDNSYHILVIAGISANTDSVVVDGFTIRNANADGGSSNKVYNGHNVQRNWGAVIAMQNSLGSRLAIRNCSIINNTAAANGGGMFNWASSLTLSHCIFSGNTAGSGGGGMYGFAASPVINNCLFSGNTASNGGGLNASGSSSPVISNCTFAGNTGSSSGGGVYNNSSSSQINNCILWGNNTGIAHNVTTPTVSYSTVQGGYTGTANLSSDPLFTNSGNGDYSLQANSPAINSGNVTGSAAGLDLAGNPRLAGYVIDRGAYESSVVSPNVLHVDNVNGNDANSGYSWANAHKTLAKSLTVAADAWYVDSILIATGTYYPTGQQNGTDRDSAFTILRGRLKVLGGYPTGGGTRNPAANPVYLDGNIGSAGTGSDNSYHVLVIAGISADADSVVMDGLTFRNGNADGGSSNKVYNGLNVQRNWASVVTMQNALAGKLAIRNCTFSNNNATANGGGLFNWGSSFTLSQCVFSGNTAGSAGGGLYNFSATSIVQNCLFTGNTASTGGGINISNSSEPQIIGCTFSGNTATAGASNGGAIYNNTSSAAIRNSILWGNSSEIGINVATPSVSYSIVQGGYSGTSNLNTNPLFTNSGTGDYTLQSSSPAINNGDNSFISSADLAGNARVTGLVVDRGAYESNVVSPNVLHVDNVNGNDNNDGYSWGSAHKTLSKSLSVVLDGNIFIDSILVAAGTYYPTGQQNGINRDSSFAILRGGIKLLGGYPSGGGVRNPAANPVYLDGNIANSSDSIDNSYHIMVIAGLDFYADSVVVDGFTFRNGLANGTGDKVYNGQLMGRQFAGGLIAINNYNGERTVVRNCKFTDNVASLGAGMVSYGTSTQIDECEFTANNAVVNGAGIYVEGGLPKISNSIFSDNAAVVGGGGMYNVTGVPVIVNCLFSGNTAGNNGGGITNLYNAPAFVINSTFSGNAAANGGGIRNGSSAKIRNCIIWGNSSSVLNAGGTPEITYSIVEGGYTGTGNLNSDPLFVNAPSYTSAPFSGGDYTLQSGSPAINSGDTVDVSRFLPSVDLAGNIRIEEVIIDRGAYESMTTVNVEINDPDLFSSIYPNPNNGKFTVVFNDDQTCETVITDIVGKIISASVLVGKSHDFDLSDEPAGMYFMRINTINQSEAITLKIIIAK
ncbi:MAG: choice-of-anchor Q domain-containing protein [Bacteroidia bacterium]